MPWAISQIYRSAIFRGHTLAPATNASCDMNSVCRPSPPNATCNTVVIVTPKLSIWAMTIAISSRPQMRSIAFLVPVRSRSLELIAQALTVYRVEE